jgi:hydrogenase maturation protease
MTKTAPDALVIGIGNPDRGDDAFGLLVARRLQARGLPGVDVIEAGGEASFIIEALAGTEAAILVDAAFSGAEPGSIHRFDASRDPLPAFLGSTSTHGFGLAQGLELARALGGLPGFCIVYAVEGRNFAIGAALSPEVGTVIGCVEARILGDLATRVR